MSKGYDCHQACLSLPKMADDEYQALRESIRAGYDKNKPIELFDGLILDGRHRYQACLDEGIEPQFITLIGINPYDYVRKVHEGRRSWLNGVQKALVIGGLLEKAGEFDEAKRRIQEEANRKRAEAMQGNANSIGSNQYESKSRTVDPQSEGQLSKSDPTPKRDHAKKHAKAAATAKAQAIGTSRANVERAETIKRASPEFARKVELGEMTPTEALRKIRNTKKIERIKALPTGQYHVIYADPPWQYNDKRETGDHRESTGAEHHYPTMPLSDLKALNVNGLAAPDSVLFCWATFPLLPDALELVKAWGFAYKTAFIWDKGAGAFGHYHNAAAELLIVATRGSGVPQNDKREDQVQTFARQEHSRKPSAWRELIDRLYPHGPRIELFRRGTPPDGWEIWGAEAETVEVEEAA